MKIITVYRAYDCTDAGGPAGEGDGPRKLIGYFSTEQDAKQAVENLGWAVWDNKRMHGEIEETQILTEDGKTGYQYAGGTLIKVHPPFVNGDADPFRVKQALAKLSEEEIKALKNNPGAW